MKKSRTCNYFDGEITDGKKSMRLFACFGFDAAAGVRRRLAKFEEKEQPVMLSNCEVKRARQGSQLEILVGKTQASRNQRSRTRFESYQTRRWGR